MNRRHPSLFVLVGSALLMSCATSLVPKISQIGAEYGGGDRLNRLCQHPARLRCD